MIRLSHTLRLRNFEPFPKIHQAHLDQFFELISKIDTILGESEPLSDFNAEVFGSSLLQCSHFEVQFSDFEAVKFGFDAEFELAFKSYPRTGNISP
jgi:hypothetical protein